MFNTWGNSWLLSWGASWGRSPSPTTVTGGHFGLDTRHYKHYRKQLERLAKIYKEKDQSKYVKNITEVVAISEDLEVATPEISAAANFLKNGQVPQIDYEAFHSDINKLLAFIKNAITLRQRELESEDELALLLLL